jgi:hypothetical protein
MLVLLSLLLIYRASTDWKAIEALEPIENIGFELK